MVSYLWFFLKDKMVEFPNPTILTEMLIFHKKNFKSPRTTPHLLLNLKDNKSCIIMQGQGKW